LGFTFIDGNPITVRPVALGVELVEHLVVGSSRRGRGSEAAAGEGEGARWGSDE